MPPNAPDNPVEDELLDDFPIRNEQAEMDVKSDELDEDEFDYDALDDQDELSTGDVDDDVAGDDVGDGDYDDAQGADNGPFGRDETELSAEPGETSEFHLADAVQFNLSFEVGEMQMSLQQLRRLLPGYTFELDTRVDSPVAIKAYGQPIGRGKIVQVGDRLGIRLLEINRDGR